MVCSKCNIDKDELEFNIRDKRKNVRHKQCKSCHSSYRAAHYLINKEKYIKKAKEWNKKQKASLSRYIHSYLQNKRCIDCGEKNIIVLEFDHISDKAFGIAEMVHNKYSINRVQLELKKCEVRCANCHRIKTARELGYWKYKI